ncbi:MAG TPA: dioxygenase [Anaerolineaceae bacterium]|nr:dioxygenase [Anaerolineaceae bacterium]
MNTDTPEKLAPVLYIPHGGGPLPLLGDPDHQELVDFLRSVPSLLGDPAAILVISAHWEEEIATVTSHPQPSLYYDYYGFPDKAYQIQYPAPGQPELAKKIYHALQEHGIASRMDEKRGLDHGVFVPLKIMYPDATIPCVQLSLLKNLDATSHIQIGKALSELRKENILILGSGFSFHNMRAFFTQQYPGEDDPRNTAFQQWLNETCISGSLDQSQREKRLIHWEEAPYARYCHPREEHLLPLHVCFGIAASPAQLIFEGNVTGKKAVSLLW